MDTPRSLSRLLFAGLHRCVVGIGLLLPLVSAAQEPSLVGQYLGAVARTAEIPVWTNSHLGARLELTAQASGNFSGKLIYSGTTLSFTGTIDRADSGSGTSSVRIPRGSLPALTLDLSFGEDLVSGSLSHPDGETVNVSGWRKVWNNSSRPATAFLGRHHFHLRTDLSEVGDGFGSFTVPADGDITVNGKLPDGNDFKTTGFVGPNGQVLVYDILHSKPGSLLGVMAIAESTDEIPSTLGTSDFGMTWFKPMQTAKAERFYREGLNTNCQISGGLYKAPAPGDVAAGLQDVVSNGYLYFSGIAENSETPAGAFFTLNTVGKVTMSKGEFNRAKATLTVKPSTGEYSGGFTLVDYDYNNQIGTDKQGNPIYRKLTRKVKYYGLIVDDGTTAVASGFYVTGSNPDSSAEPPTTLLTSPLTGGVASIQRNPEAPTPLEIGFEQGNYNVTEGEVTMVRLNALYELTENRTFKINVLPGTANSADLTATSLTVTIPAGSASAEIELPVKDDGLDEEEETFRLSVVDGAGFDLNENAVVEVTISDDDFSIVIIGDPASQLVELNSNVEMRVEADGSDIMYQWLRQNANISGATSNPLFLRSVQFAQAGSYKVKASNAINEQTSDVAELGVVDISNKLMALLPDSTATLNAGVAGTAGSLTYQWQVGGIDVENDTSPAQRITGAKTPTLVIKNVSSEDIGDYACVVTQVNSETSLSTGNFFLRLPSAVPSLPDLELPEGQVLRPYYYETLFDTDFEVAPGSFSATGLPNGLRIDPNTGVISGTPMVPVTDVRIVVSATNPRGTTTAEGRLTIRAFPASALGTFQGLVARSFVDDGSGPASTWPQSELGARIELTTTVTGSFSGKIIGTTTQNFSGALTFEEDEVLIGSASVPQANKKLPPMSLQLRIYLPDQTLTGSLVAPSSSTLSEPPPPASVWGWRNVWTKTQPATDFVGRYNFTLTDTAGASPLESPAGTGFGSFVVPGSGTFNVTGNLPDGTAFICNTFLGPRGEVLLFQPTYKNPGSLHGAVQIQLPYSESDDMPLRPFDKGPAAVARLTMYSESGQELDLTWFKPFQTDTKDKTYRSGFGLRSLSVDGGLYTPPEPGQIVMDLPEVPTNAQIQFAADDTGLDVMPTGFTITAAGKSVIPTGSANPYKLTFTLNAETGQFNGAFTRRDEDPSRPPLYSETTGKLLRPQGYFTRNARFYGIIAGNPTNATIMGTGYYTIQQLPRPDDEPPVTEANAQNVTASFVLTRNDNAEEPLSFGFTQGDVVTLTEGEPEMQVTVSISSPVNSRRTVPISLQHLTSSGADVTLSSASVVFEPDQSEAYVTLSVTQDNLDEEEEYLYLRLADGVGYNLSTRRLGVAIVDDDESVQIQSITPAALARTGEGANLSVTATGSEPLSYQWRLNGVPIPGALSSEYYIYPGSLSDGGRYDVVVSNRVNSQISPASDLAMLDSREFYFPVAAGATANLALNINAPAGSVTYEWSRTPGGIPLTDDARITGTNSRTLMLRNVTPDDEGDYYCRVISVDSSLESPMEMVSPVQRLVIVTAPPLLVEIPDQFGSVARYFSYQVEFMTDSFRYPATFSATNLPSGLSIDSVTGLISGSPRVTVTNSSFTITATNAAGSTSSTGRITIEGLPDGVVGTFHGLVGRHLGAEDPNIPGEYTPPWPDAELGGLIELTTLASGSFSGKVTYDGTAHNFTGFLSNDESNPVAATVLIQRTGKPVLFLDFTLDPTTDAVVGALRNMAPGQGFEAPVNAWRKVWSSATPATAYAGTYNFSIATAEGGNERSPGGYGYGTCTVPVNGAAFEIKGRLPDGKPFVCSSQLGPQGQFVVHQALYARTGSVLSLLSLSAMPDAEAGEPSFVEVLGESNLFKPRQTAGSETIYTAGIGPVSLSYTGGRYVAPLAGEVVMGVEDVIDNASISMTGAGADYSETPPNTVFRIRASGTTVMKTGEDNPAKINVTEVKPATGEFKGSFTLSDTNPSSLTTKISRTSDFFGLFIQMPSGETVGRGYFVLKQMPDPSALPPITSANAPSYSGMVDVLPGPGPSF